MSVRSWLSFSILFVTLVGGEIKAEIDKETESVPDKPVAFIDIKNSDEGAYPGGSQPVKGKWSVRKDGNFLEVSPLPMLENWFEFGPEIREKEAVVRAAGRAPSQQRIKSRFGVGLYGPNGFQLRLAFGHGQIELVRRGAVLKTLSYSLDDSITYELELAAFALEKKWRIEGRVWDAESERPDEPLMTYVMYADELLFPLAGRTVLTATPFSGSPVAFDHARVYDGPVPSDVLQVESEEAAKTEGAETESSD